MREKLSEHKPIITICVLLIVATGIYAVYESGFNRERVTIFILVVAVLLFLGGVFAMSLIDIYYKSETATGGIAVIGAVVTWIITWFILMGLMVEPIVVIGPLDGPYGETGGITTNSLLAAIPAAIVAGVIIVVGRPIEKKIKQWYSRKWRETKNFTDYQNFERAYRTKIGRISNMCIIIVIIIIVIVASWALYRIFSLPDEENIRNPNVLEPTDYQIETSPDDINQDMDDEAYEKTPVERGYPSNDLQYYIDHPDESMPKELIDQVMRPDYEDVAVPNY